MPPVRIIIGGDTYFGEFYQSKREKVGKVNYLRSRGYLNCLERILPLLERADCVAVNLECALTTQTTSELEGKKGWILAGDPEQTVTALREANVSVAMLGNNHTKDYGAAVLLETIHHLEAGGITPIGAGANAVEAQKAFVREFDLGESAFKFAIISAFHFTEFHKGLGFYAEADFGGVNKLDIQAIGRQISNLKRDGYFVVVSPHWGQNFFLRNHSQATLSQGLINGGVDLIAGHGPHLLNEIHRQQGAWAIYSLGNLVFNSEGDYEARQVLPFSLVLELEVETQSLGHAITMNLYPIVSCNQITKFQPRFVDERQFEQVTAALRALHYDPRIFDERLHPRAVDGRFCFSAKLVRVSLASND